MPMIELWLVLDAGGILPIMAVYGEVPPERGTFFRPQVYESAGVLLVAVYERIGISVIWAFERAQRANR